MRQRAINAAIHEIVSLLEFEFSLGKPIIAHRVFVGREDLFLYKTMEHPVGRGVEPHMGMIGSGGCASWPNESLFFPFSPASFVFVCSVWMFVCLSCCIFDIKPPVPMWLHTLSLASLSLCLLGSG